jgi:ribosome-associated toxin RatA of RatAB toxin-antitoxin module
VADQNSQPSNLEHTVSSVLVQATVQDCYAVGIDIAAYPEWVENLRTVEILTTDDQGLPATVRFEAEGLGRMSSYVLAYDLSEVPHKLAWNLVSGDLAREIEGRYVFHDMTEDPSLPVTEVDYELTIDLAVPLPGFVKRRAEDKIVKSALDRFKQRVEGSSV